VEVDRLVEAVALCPSEVPCQLEVAALGPADQEAAVLSAQEADRLVVAAAALELHPKSASYRRPSTSLLISR
jgi:hypothetical protein